MCFPPAYTVLSSGVRNVLFSSIQHVKNDRAHIVILTCVSCIILEHNGMCELYHTIVCIMLVRPLYIDVLWYILKIIHQSISNEKG